MSPRTYRSARRRETADATRQRIIAAACDLLDAEGRLKRFSIDAVAHRAGVARMTVYYQFESKAGLLQALFDSLAARGHLDRLPQVFQEPDPARALDAFVATFGGFWAANRIAHRHLRAASLLDPELAAALTERSERRRPALRILVNRLAGREAGAPGRPPASGAMDDAVEDAVNVLFMLTQIETFDTLAGPSGRLEDAVPVVQRLAHGAVRDALGPRGAEAQR